MGRVLDAPEASPVRDNKHRVLGVTTYHHAKGLGQTHTLGRNIQRALIGRRAPKVPDRSRVKF